MSFLAPKRELPAGLSETPGRTTNGSPTEVLPMVHGRARLVARWQTPVLHWLPRAGKAGDYWHFSCLGWLCLGPVDEIRRVWVGDKPGAAYADFDANRSDYPGTDYIQQTLASETPATLRAYWGLETQADPAAFINGTVIRNAAHPMAGKPHPRYSGICYIILQDVIAGVSTETTPPLPKVEVEVYRRSATAYSFGGIAWGAHPVGIVKDILTAKRGGGKLPESYFAAGHWADAMQRLMDVGVAGKTGVDLFISAVLDQPRPAGDQVADVLAYIGGHIRERDGKLQIDWFPSDGSTADPDGLREISEHQRAGDLELDSTDIEQMKTKVIASGLDYLADPAFSEASEDEQVPYAVKFIGSQRPPETVSRPFFITRAQLKAYAKLQAIFLATPQLKATVPVLRQYATHPDGITPLRPGDRFNLDDQEKGLDLVVRITERSEDGARVIFKVVGERGAFPQPYQPALDPRADLTRPPVADLARYAVAQLPPDLSDAADTVVAALVERASNDTQAFDVHMSPTDVWPGQVIASSLTRFAVAAVLQTDMASGLADVTVNVNTVGNDWSYLRSQSILEQADDQLLAWHAREWMSIGTITPLGGGSYSMTLLRARLGSLPAAHAIAAVLFIIPRADLIVLQHANFATVEAAGVYDAGVATKSFKVRPLGAGGLQGNLTAAFSTTLRDPTPDAVTGLSATTGTGRLVRLKWDSVPGALVNEYQIWRATGPAFADEAMDGEVSGTTYADIVPALDVQYRYRVRAMGNDETEGLWSGYVYATPTPIDAGDLDPAILADIAQALADAADAITAAAGAQATADGKVTTFVQAAPPVAEGIGDLWVDTDDNKKLYRWSGSAWVLIRDDGIASALTNAANAQATADGKVVTFYQTSAPAASAVGDLWVDTDDGNRLYRWSGAAWVDVQGIRSTVPNTPGAPTFLNEGTKLTDDGAVQSWIAVTMPALPANAAGLDLLYRVNGATQWRLADQKQLGGWEARVDDLSPDVAGVAYEFATRAWSNFGIESAVSAILSRTAPGKTTNPNPPTSVVYTAGNSAGFGRPAQYQGTALVACLRVNWTPPVDKDVKAYEWVIHPTDTDANADANAGSARPEVIPEAIVLNPTFTGFFFRVRSVDRSGRRSAWAGGGTSISSYSTYPAGNMSEQNRDNVIVGAIKTGDPLASSVRKIRARYVESVVVTLAGGGPLEDFAISISNRGFSAKPDSHSVQVAGSSSGNFRELDSTYVFDHGSNSSSTAYVSVFRKDGANLTAQFVRLSIEFIEYD